MAEALLLDIRNADSADMRQQRTLIFVLNAERGFDHGGWNSSREDGKRDHRIVTGKVMT